MHEFITELARDLREKKFAIEDLKNDGDVTAFFLLKPELHKLADAHSVAILLRKSFLEKRDAAQKLEKQNQLRNAYERYGWSLNLVYLIVALVVSLMIEWPTMMDTSILKISFMYSMPQIARQHKKLTYLLLNFKYGLPWTEVWSMDASVPSHFGQNKQIKQA